MGMEAESIKTILDAAAVPYFALDASKAVGFLHCDIKMDNFLVKLGVAVRPYSQTLVWLRVPAVAERRILCSLPKETSPLQPNDLE